MVKITSIPSNKPSPSVSGLLGSDEVPVRLACSAVRKWPNDSDDSAPIQGVSTRAPAASVR